MSKRIVGNIVGIPSPHTDFSETDPTKGSYLKNRDELLNLIENKTGKLTPGKHNQVYIESPSGVTKGIEMATQAMRFTIPQRDGTGALIVKAEPTLDNEAVCKSFVERKINEFVANGGGSGSGGGNTTSGIIDLGTFQLIYDEDYNEVVDTTAEHSKACDNARETGVYSVRYEEGQVARNEYGQVDEATREIFLSQTDLIIVVADIAGPYEVVTQFCLTQNSIDDGNTDYISPPKMRKYYYDLEKKKYIWTPYEELETSRFKVNDINTSDIDPMQCYPSVYAVKDYVEKTLKENPPEVDEDAIAESTISELSRRINEEGYNLHNDGYSPVIIGAAADVVDGDVQEYFSLNVFGMSGFTYDGEDDAVFYSKTAVDNIVSRLEARIAELESKLA